MDKEVDEIIADELHEKYDYLYDKSYQDFREVNDEFDPTAHDKDKEEELFTTEMTDPELDHVYKRYKALGIKNTKTLEELREEIKTLSAEMN